MDIEACRCKRLPLAPCHASPTEEDLLCDFCRTRDCSAISFNDEWNREHVIIEGIEWQAELTAPILE
jgi:hypothetical protein